MKISTITKNRKYWIVTGFSLLALVVNLIFTSKAHAIALPEIVPAFEVLGNTNTGMGAAIKSVWTSLITLTNGFVVLVLIVVAFAQILRLNINTYGVKKILPTLVLAIIAANFSFLFCRLMVDFSNIAIAALTSNGDLAPIRFIGTDAVSPTSMHVAEATKNGQAGLVLWFCIAQIFLLAAGVIVLILAFLFFIRLWMIYFLVALAPLAIMSMVLPQTKSLFNQWWTNFSKWVFMPVVSVFWLWLGQEWYTDVTNGSPFLQFLFAGVCFYLAITTPFKMGGAIMNQWASLGKKAWGKTGGAAWNSTGGAGINAARSAINTRWDRQKDKLKNRWYATPMGTGMLNRGARQTRLSELEKDVHTKRLGDAAKNEYYRAYQAHLSGRQVLQPAQLGRLYAKMRGAIGDERESFASLPPERLQPELDRRHALYNAAEITRYALPAALLGTLKTEEHMADTMNREQHHETKAILARARQMLSSQITRQPTLNVMGYTDAAGVFHPGLIPQAQEANWRSGDIARSLYATSAVGNQSGAQSPQAQVQAAQAQVQTARRSVEDILGPLADPDTAQQLSNSAANGVPYDEAIEEIGDGALKVEIERFKPEAKQTLKENYGTMVTGNRTLSQLESAGFVHEAGEKSEVKARIASLIGNEGAERLSTLASHGTLSFDDALKSSGVDVSGLSAGAQQVVRDTYQTIQKSKDQMVEEAYLSSQNEIEEELQGIKMVVDGVSHRGVRFGRMKSELSKSEQMYKNGDIAGARSIVEGVSGSLGVSGDANIEKALQKRMEHLKSGVSHFDNFYKSFGTIADAAERRAAIEMSKKMLQVNPGSYINDIRDKKFAEARVNAEASTAVHLASSSLVTNTAVKNLPVAQMANNPIALQALTDAISGLHQSLEEHGSKVEHLSPQGGASASSMNQVMKMDPVSAGTKQMVVDALNHSINQGLIGSSTKISEAFSNKAFRNNIAEGMKKALRETKTTSAPPQTPTR